MPDPSTPFDPARDLTVVIPTHNRSRYFLHYLSEGFWDGVRIRIVCDGCRPEVIEELRTKTQGHPITVVDGGPQGGVAHAVRIGVGGVETSHFMFCGDDDFNVDYGGFLEEAAATLANEEGVLFVTMPELYGFTPRLQARLQYDRRPFHGKTGRELLAFLTRTGEMSALVAGSLFRTEVMKPLLAEPFFRVSEDFVLLSRLCGRFPDHRVHVAERGRRMRLIHAGSLSARSGFTPEKALMNLLSMTVSGFYLVELGGLEIRGLIQLLHHRGDVLEKAYGLGRAEAHLIGALLDPEGQAPATDDGRRALAFLRASKEGLPPEFGELVSDAGRRMLEGQGRTSSVPDTPAPGDAPVFFVGGGARTGTTLMELLLCQAPETNPMVPEAHFLRSFLAAYRMARASAAHQIPQLFDDDAAFRDFHAGLFRRYLDYLRARFPDASRLALKDPEMTRTFPELFELYPEARFVVMVRDPRDVITSLLNVGRKMLAQGRQDLVAKAAHARDMDWLCAYFRSFYDPMLQVRDARFWQHTLFVRYEDLVRHPGVVVPDVAAFTGLTLRAPDDREALDTGTVSFSERTESPWYSQLYGKGISGSRVGTYTSELSPGEVRQVEAACAEYMDLFNYENTARAAG